jgi:hypothetical protein
MTTTLLSFTALSDRDLLTRLCDAARDERQATATLIALLLEVDSRRLYLAEGCSSLFTYCTQVLQLSEHAAYGRIAAARATRKFPSILARLENGTLTLTSVCLLAPHLTEDNHVEVLDEASHQCKRDVERLVARLAPKPDVQPSLRKLPPRPGAGEGADVTPPATELTPAAATLALTHQAAVLPAAALRSSNLPKAKLPVPVTRAMLQPLSPERFKLQLTIGRESHDKLRRLQDLLRHSVPNGDLEAIFDRAVALLLEHLERTKLAASRNPRASVCRAAGTTRYIPAAVKRQVWARDNGQCAFRGARGRCSAKHGLEFHHVVPFAAGGLTIATNLELRCRAHNAYEAALWFEPIVET